MTGPPSSPKMHSAFNAANIACLRASTRQELFQDVCTAVVDGGGMVAAAVFAGMNGEPLQSVAIAGAWAHALTDPEVPLDEFPVALQRLVAEARHSDRPCVVGNLDYDASVGCRDEVGAYPDSMAAAVVPFAVTDASDGVFLFIMSGHCAPDGEFADQCRYLVKNMAFALERFARQAEKERITCMLSALSATTEAILRADTREKLFRLVCEAAVLGGKFTMTTIALAEPGSDFLRIVAATGPGADASRGVRLATSAAYPEGRGLTGTAFRTQEPCISNDYLDDQNRCAFHGIARDTGARSGAALPLLSRGQSVGALLVMSAERNTLTPEFIELLQRLAGNVSFALENFDRADERAQAEERIKYLATHDGLTGLPNRAMFSQLLGFSIKTAERYQRHCALLFIDLDRFKIVNDSLGHAVGDALLVEVAARIRAGVRGSDVVARLGGDEFVVVVNEVTESRQVAKIARGLLTAIGKPMLLSGVECRVTASIGIAMYPEDGADDQTLTKNADVAMYLAKSEGKNDVRYFSKEIETQSIERLTLEAGLRHALERNELRLHYQPKLDVATGHIAGVEALLRWMHPELGLLPPLRFIPLAEETGLIVPIGRWVLQTACKQHVAWQREGLPVVSMAINVSPRQFSDKNLLADIDEALATSGMDPTLLQIEITESMVMLNVDRAIKVLDQIQSRGVRLAIDDFGTGYSSMSMMKRFPIDTIKIDRSFIRDVGSNSEDKAIAQAIIDMGKALGLTVVAEGVETIEQDEFLRSHACDELQGFLFSKPATADKMAELLRAQCVGIATS